MSWKSKPSCYVVANEDRTVQPDLRLFVAKRTSAVFETDSSYDPVLSQTDLALDVRNYSAIVDAFTAMVITSQAGLNWLSAQPPDLEEVRRALGIIAKEGKRAGENVVRLRARMNMSPTADDALVP